MGTSADDADLVLAVRGGDQAAFGELFARWSDRCYDVARRIVHDDGIAAEVAQDVFLVAWQQLGTLREPSAFGGWVLRSARNRALNRLERERRSVAVADDAPVLAGLTAQDAPDREAEAAMIALDHRELVDAATVVLGEREASVLDLHLRHGLSAAELAEELGVTPNNAHQLIFRTKRKLAAGIRAWVLVRGGRPSCPALAAALEGAGAQAFGQEAVRVVGDHVEGCEECADRQAAVLDPAALFATVPVIAMAPGVRASVLDALRAAGVPLGDPGATAAHGDPTSGPAGDPVGGSDDPAAGPSVEELPIGPPSDHRARAGRRRLLAAAAAVLLLGGAAVQISRAGGDEQTVAAGSTTSAGVAEPRDPEPAEPGTARSGSSTTVTALSGPGTTASTSPESAPSPDGSGDAPATTVPGEAQPVPTTAPQQDPVTTVPPAGPTTTAPSRTTTTAPPAPVVRRFDAVTATTRGGDCPPARYATTLWWLVDGATTVTIEAQGVGPFTGLAASGRRVVCRFASGPPAGGWRLTASGPGGTTTADA